MTSAGNRQGQPDPSTALDAVSPPVRPREIRHPFSTATRAMIAVAVVVAGILGFLITYSVFDIACARSGCAAIVPVLWGLGGAILGVVGAAVVSVLLARSFAEWNMNRSLTDADDAASAPKSPNAC